MTLRRIAISYLLRLRFIAIVAEESTQKGCSQIIDRQIIILKSLFIPGEQS